MKASDKVLEEISNASHKLVLEKLIIPGTRGIARVFALAFLLFKGTIKISKVDRTISIR